MAVKTYDATATIKPKVTRLYTGGVKRAPRERRAAKPTAPTPPQPTVPSYVGQEGASLSGLPPVVPYVGPQRPERRFQQGQYGTSFNVPTIVRPLLQLSTQQLFPAPPETRRLQEGQYGAAFNYDNRLQPTVRLFGDYPVGQRPKALAKPPFPGVLNLGLNGGGVGGYGGGYSPYSRYGRGYRYSGGASRYMNYLLGSLFWRIPSS